MLGMGAMEIAVILIVALIIFGPGKLPEIAQTAGRTLRDFRSATQDITGDFRQTMNELQETADDFKNTAIEFQEEAESTFNEAQEGLVGAAKDLEQTTSETANEVNEGLSLDQMDSAATRPSRKAQRQIAAAREDSEKSDDSAMTTEAEAKPADSKKAKTSANGSKSKAKTTAKAKSADTKSTSKPAASSKKKKAAADSDADRKKKKRRERQPAVVSGSTSVSKDDPLADLTGVDDGPVLSSRSRSNGR